MQAKKRAKPIQFGKTPEPVKKPARDALQSDAGGEVKKPEAEPEEVKPQKAVVSESPEIEEPAPKKTQPEETASEEEKEGDAKVTSESEFLSDQPAGAKAEEQSSFSVVMPESEEKATSASSEAKDEEQTLSPTPELSPTPPPATFSDSPEEAPAKSSTAHPGETPGHSFSVFDSPQEEPEAPPKKKGFLKTFLFIVLIAFLLGISFFAGTYYASSGFSLGLKPAPTPVAVQPTSPPENSEAKAVDLEAYSIKILNGSGITGEAAKVKTALVEAGFKVAIVGNADRNDYTKTIIAAKKDVDEAYLKKLREVLGKSYSLEADSILPEVASGEADVTITIGSTPSQ